MVSLTEKPFIITAKYIHHMFALRVLSFLADVILARHAIFPPYLVIMIACKCRRVSGCRFSPPRSQASHVMTLKSLCEAGYEGADCSQSGSVPSSVVLSSPN